MTYPAFAEDQAKIATLVASRTPYGQNFPCGHRNTKGNQLRTDGKLGSVGCLTCQRARQRTNGFPCGHPFVPDNIVLNKHAGGRVYKICRICKREKRRQRDGVLSPHKLRDVKLVADVTLPNLSDPVIALYHAEKAKRAARSDPLMDDAKRAYAKLLEDSQPHRKGRPKGSRNGAWADAAVTR